MNAYDMIIFLYSVTVKNRHRNGFLHISAFSQHLKSLGPASLEVERLWYF